MNDNVSETKANLGHRDAAMVGAGELALNAGRVVAVNLIRAIPAVVLMVTLPRAEDTAPIVAPELVWTARVVCCNADKAFNTNIENKHLNFNGMCICIDLIDRNALH